MTAKFPLAEKFSEAIEIACEKIRRVYPTLLYAERYREGCATFVSPFHNRIHVSIPKYETHEKAKWHLTLYESSE